MSVSTNASGNVQYFVAVNGHVNGHVTMSKKTLYVVHHTTSGGFEKLKFSFTSGSDKRNRRSGRYDRFCAVTFWLWRLFSPHRPFLSRCKPFLGRCRPFLSRCKPFLSRCKLYSLMSVRGGRAPSAVNPSLFSP